MSAFLCHVCCLHTCRTAADNQHFFLFRCFFNRVGFYRWIYRTWNRFTKHNAGQTSSAADTRTNVFCFSSVSLIGKFTVTQIRTSDHTDVRLSVRNQFFRNPRFINPRNRGNRNMNMLFDFFAGMSVRCRCRTRCRHGTAAFNGIAAWYMNEINPGFF